MIKPQKEEKGKMNYAQIKKLDEESLAQMTEGSGPTDECLCSVLAPDDDKPRRGIRASIKKAFAAMSGPSKKNRTVTGGHSVDIPLSYTKGGKGIYTTKEAVKRHASCGKCGCDNEKFVLKHSFANIKITAPDVSSICPCPNDCLPNKAQLNDNIRVTIERMHVLDVDNVDSEFSMYSDKDGGTVSEPAIRTPVREDENVSDFSDLSEWSNGAD